MSVYDVFDIVNDFSSELSAQVNKQTLKQVWNDVQIIQINYYNIS